MTPKQLKAWRKKTGYSQGKLARVLGVATQTVYRWESGTREIPSFLHLTLECVKKKTPTDVGASRSSSGIVD